MSKEKDDFSKDVESIFKKTIDINKHYLKQSTTLFKEFGTSGRNLKSISPLRTEVMMGAFTSFAKLSLDHYKNMMDLGFALTKKAFVADDIREQEEENPEAPSFVLSAEAHPGTEVNLRFILDNVKEDKAECQLIYSEYVNEEDPDNSHNLLTTFTPQSFHLPPGISQNVAIHIAVDADLSPGIYQSKVQVMGFEPAYFLVRLTITPKPLDTPPKKPTKKTSGNGRGKKQ